MRKLAILHHQCKQWIPALQQAEPRLEIRGWHPQDPAPDPVWLADCEALFAWNIPLGFLGLMPALRWVQNSGAGVDHLVAHPELAAGVILTRVDGQFGFWMARYALGHFLGEVQRIEACREEQERHHWDGRLLAEGVTGKSALVVGFGRIGRRIGQAFQSLGMEVRGFVRTPRTDPDFALSIADDLKLWLPQARVCVICAPLTTETRGFVNAELLAHSNPALTLINVGRGEQVVIPDLLAALDLGRLHRAVLDVVPQEPLPADSPLWSHPGITLTPHHAGPSLPEAILPDILPNLRRYAEGLPILGGVDRVRGY